MSTPPKPPPSPPSTPRPISPRFRHWCEVCGVAAVLTPLEVFNAGWDAPPSIGAFGVLSPRTCGGCSIERTLWFRLINKQLDPDALSAHDRAVLAHIAAEPESMLIHGDTDD